MTLTLLPAQRALLGALMESDVAQTAVKLNRAMNGSYAKSNDTVAELRRILKPIGADIHGNATNGWTISADDKEKIKATL